MVSARRIASLRVLAVVVRRSRASDEQSSAAGESGACVTHNVRRSSRCSAARVDHSFGPIGRSASAGGSTSKNARGPGSTSTTPATPRRDAIISPATAIVSIPLLLDRDVGAAVAIQTSIRVVLRSPVVVAIWGLMVVAVLAIGAIPLLVGLAIAVPVLGHATWHLYRRAVVPAGDMR